MRGESTSFRNAANIGLFTGGTAKSKFASSGFYASGEIEKDYTFNSGLQLGTALGLSYASILQEAVQETGGADFNYNIDKAKASSFVTSVGIDIAKVFGRKSSTITPTAFARVDYDWLAKRNNKHEIVVNSPLFGSYTQTGQNRGPLAATIGAGLQVSISKNMSFSASYGHVYTSNGHEDELGIDFSWRF